MTATPAVKDLFSTSPLWRAFEDFEARCPDLIALARWQAAVDDGRAFLTEWCEQAESFGWHPENLFGLTPIPEKPSPLFERTARYDRLGLVWLLQKLPIEIYDIVEDDEGDEVIEQNVCFCGRSGTFAYKNSAGILVWYCGSHRLAQWWADARLTVDSPPVCARKKKLRRVFRCRGWVTRRVVGLTETEATIRTSAGGTTVYRRSGGGAK
jgi:hypothetical protein